MMGLAPDTEEGMMQVAPGQSKVGESRVQPTQGPLLTIVCLNLIFLYISEPRPGSIGGAFDPGTPFCTIPRRPTQRLFCVIPQFSICNPRSPVARHLNIVEDLATANPDVPTVYEDRKSRRKKDMDENDLLTLAESVRLSRSQRGAWLKDKGMPGSPSVESLNSPGGSSPSDGASPANPDLSGSSPGEEDAGNHGSPEDRDFRLAMNAAVKQVTDAEMEKPRSPGVSILASSPVETYVPADSSLPMGAGEEWMNALIRENTLVAQIGSQNRGASTSVAYMQPLVGATVAEKVQAFEAVAG
jgi:hypothetical protein